MGGSSWSDDFYNDRVADRAKTGTPTFHHDAAVKAGTAKRGTHDKLNPKGVTRESRDSDAHPESVAIAVMFDVTGSMGSIPVELQKKLPQLMGLLLRKNYVKDPQVMFGAIGDWTCDVSPLQVGQFESGVEMDEDIGLIYLEGNGGGQNTESYQNAFYFFAKHTSIDCFEKRGKKGYLFLIGDEHPYPSSKKKEINEIFGDTVESDISLAQLTKDVQEKYEVFFIIPISSNAARGDMTGLKKHWGEVVGPERVLLLEEPSGVCEIIGSTIGLFEGIANPDDIAADLKAAGVSDHVAKSVATALDPLAKSTALARTGTGSNLPEKSTRSALTERL